MARKIFTPDQIVATLRQIEVTIAQGQIHTHCLSQAGISDVIFYRWRKGIRRFAA